MIGWVDLVAIGRSAPSGLAEPWPVRGWERENLGTPNTVVGLMVPCAAYSSVAPPAGSYSMTLTLSKPERLRFSEQ